LITLICHLTIEFKIEIVLYACIFDFLIRKKRISIEEVKDLQEDRDSQSD